MRFTSTYITPLLVAGAAAVAIAVAPTAAAAPTTSQPSTAQMSCGSVGSGSECITPGNAQINDSPPGVDYYPYGGEGFLLGGFGGFHGGHR